MCGSLRQKVRVVFVVLHTCSPNAHRDRLRQVTSVFVDLHERGRNARIDLKTPHEPLAVKADRQVRGHVKLEDAVVALLHAKRALEGLRRHAKPPGRQARRVDAVPAIKDRSGHSRLAAHEAFGVYVGGLRDAHVGTLAVSHVARK